MQAELEAEIQKSLPVFCSQSYFLFALWKINSFYSQKEKKKFYWDHFPTHKKSEHIWELSSNSLN